MKVKKIILTKMKQLKAVTYKGVKEYPGIKKAKKIITQLPPDGFWEWMRGML